MKSLYVTWRGNEEGDQGVWSPVGRLDFDEGTYRFCYTKGAETLRGFHLFSQMNDVNQVYESDTLFPVFANRMLSPSRSEYESFLTWCGFDPSNAPDPVTLLGVTRGIRQTDSIEVFPCPVPDKNGWYVNTFFLQGAWGVYSTAIDRFGNLEPDDKLFPILDPCNVVSEKANVLVVRIDDPVLIVGCVPRYLSNDMGPLIQQRDPDEFVELSVAQINKDAPLQQRVLCQMKICWPDGFMPCSGEAFDSIPNGLKNV